MFVCPTCARPLARVKGSPGVYWVCSRCAGRSATVSLLRRHLPREVVNALWQAARAQAVAGSRRCPSCSGRMAVVAAPLPAPAPAIDVCTRCQMVWFDAREYEALPALPRAPGPDDALPPAARQALALIELKAIRERAERDDLGAPGPDEWWQWIPALLGMPIEDDAPAVACRPWVTWGVTLAATLVSAYALLGNPESVIDAWGLVPAEWWRDGGLTLVTSFFIQGGILHLVGNMYILLLFGDNVEEVLGRWRFALLLLAATLAGHAVHILGEPRSALPCVGASGGISGVLAYYALRFPHARIGILWRFYLLFRWVRLPAYAVFAMWLALQVAGVWAQVRGFSHVSALAHLGGAAAGALAWVLTRPCVGPQNP